MWVFIGWTWRFKIWQYTKYNQEQGVLVLYLNLNILNKPNPKLHTRLTGLYQTDLKSLHLDFYLDPHQVVLSDNGTLNTCVEKTPFRTMLKKVRNDSWIRPFNRICTRTSWDLFWAETHRPSKFGGNLFTGLCLILLTNQQTKRNKYKQNFLSSGNKFGV